MKCLISVIEGKKKGRREFMCLIFWSLHHHEWCSALRSGIATRLPLVSHTLEKKVETRIRADWYTFVCVCVRLTLKLEWKYSLSQAWDIWKAEISNPKDFLKSKNLKQRKIVCLKRCSISAMGRHDKMPLGQYTHKVNRIPVPMFISQTPYSNF